MLNMITFDTFQEIDLRIGTIQEVEEIEEADKLLLLSVDIGSETRQVVAGIKQDVSDPEALLDTQVVLVANLEPKEMFGHESQGMILAARGDELSLVSPRQSVAPGTSVE